MHCSLLDAHFGEDKLTLEGLPLALASPDTQDQRHLDVGQGHEVLGNVKDELVHECGGDVVAIHGVVLPQSLADVVVGAEHGDVGAVPHGRLEEGVDHALSPGDVLLVVRRVVGQAPPPVLLRLLRLVHLLLVHRRHGSDDDEPPAALLMLLLLPDAADSELLLVIIITPEEAVRRRGSSYRHSDDDGGGGESSSHNSIN